MMSVGLLQVCLRRESEVERGVALPCPVPGQRTGPFPGAPGAHGSRAGQGRQNTKHLVVGSLDPTQSSLKGILLQLNRRRTIQNRASCPPRAHHLCTTIQSKSTNSDTVDRTWRFQNSGTLPGRTIRQRRAKCLPCFYPLTYYARPREYIEDRPDPLVMVINLVISLGGLPVPSKSDGVLDMITVIKRSVVHCTRKIPQDRRRILTPAGSAGLTGVVDVMMMETCTMGTSPRQWAIRRVQVMTAWSAFGHHNVLSACVTDYKHS
ncbi:hypothetical protein QR685DRAFT_569524 [Neurospora intermedia]|uniref:Uncharacterized protein n=1 Tax=Neurospora intermedia TaxID=5142 RepID=A0ABR3DLG8_NEUIN